MIPQLIQDYISKINDKSVHKERRQFYADTLRAIQKEATKTLEAFDKEVSSSK